MRTQQIWETYEQDIRRFVLSKVKDETIADDILQETFIKVHTKIHTLNDEAKLKAWIFSIANSTVMDHFRHKVNINVLSHGEGFIDDEIHVHDEKDCLRGIINSLPKKYRDPLFLSDIKGMKQADIAKQLNLPLPTTKSRIQRARKQIVQGYMKCCDFKINEQGFLVGEVKDKAECKICR